MEKKQPWIYPRALKPGDRLAVLALSSPGDLEALAAVAEKLSDLNLTFDFLPSCYGAHGHLAGTDATRLADLHKAFEDPQYAGILCMKGGAGSYRLLDQVDYDLIRRHPKPLIGYSDVTAMHLALQAKARLVTFHGPMALSKWPAWTTEQFKRMLMGATEGLRLENPPGESVQVLVPGKATGRLVGGNLSLLVNTLGSPYEIDTKNAILVIEDTLEPTYAIDRMLNALRLAGKLHDAAGILLGTWTACYPEEKNSYPGRDLELSEIFQELVVPVGRPTLANVWFGHNVPQITLPLGVRMAFEGSVDALGQELATLTLLENAVLLDKAYQNEETP